MKGVVRAVIINDIGNARRVHIAWTSCVWQDRFCNLAAAITAKDEVITANTSS